MAGPPDVSIDSNGNLTQKIEGSDTWVYEWDAENQLKRVLKNSVEQARFAYDALGRRVEKIAGGVTTTYTYDGQDILREVAGSTTLKYVQGSGIDELLAQEDGAGALTSFHADGLGSIVKTTNSAGAVMATRRYDAFGNLEFGATNGFAFTGREWDSESGLYYYRARYYDPTIGRFISEDPIRFDGGINFYAYVENNPVNRTDPLGLRAAGGTRADCDYYKSLCELEKGGKCGGFEDSYACSAYQCCLDFGEGPKQNCVRDCLIEEDKTCARLPEPARQNCRVRAHWVCYMACKFVPVQGVPLKCVPLVTGR